MKIIDFFQLIIGLIPVLIYGLLIVGAISFFGKKYLGKGWFLPALILVIGFLIISFIK